MNGDSWASYFMIVKTDGVGEGVGEGDGIGIGGWGDFSNLFFSLTTKPAKHHKM